MPVAEVMPVAKERGVELAGELQHLRLAGDGIERGEVFQSQADVQRLEFGKQLVQGLAERVESAADMLVAQVVEAFAAPDELVGEGEGTSRPGGGRGRGRGGLPPEKPRQPAGAPCAGGGGALVLGERLLLLGGMGGFGNAPGVENDGAGADFGREAGRLEDGLDGLAARPAVRLADGVDFGVALGGAHGDGAEGVHAGDGDLVGGDGGADIVRLAVRKGVAELDGVETELARRLDDGAAAFDVAGIPVGGQGEMGLHRRESVPQKDGSGDSGNGIVV